MIEKDTCQVQEEYDEINYKQRHSGKGRNFFRVEDPLCYYLARLSAQKQLITAHQKK